MFMQQYKRFVENSSASVWPQVLNLYPDDLLRNLAINSMFDELSRNYVNIRPKLTERSRVASKDVLPGLPLAIQPGTKQTTGGQTTSGDQLGLAMKGDRYKTELCRTFSENGSCRYGDKCQFAHGEAELRTVSRHPKYKTEMCRTFHTTGFCPYGTRCHFIHGKQEQSACDQRPALVLPPAVHSPPAKWLNGLAEELSGKTTHDLLDNNSNIDALDVLLRAVCLDKFLPSRPVSKTQSDTHRPMSSLPFDHDADGLPLSPTHSLDSTLCSLSEHSLSPCTSPTDDIYSFWPTSVALQNMLQNQSRAEVAVSSSQSGCARPSPRRPCSPMCGPKLWYDIQVGCQPPTSHGNYRYLSNSSMSV